MTRTFSNCGNSFASAINSGFVYTGKLCKIKQEKKCTACVGKKTLSVSLKFTSKASMKTSNKLGLDCFVLYNPLYKFWFFCFSTFSLLKWFYRVFTLKILKKQTVLVFWNPAKWTFKKVFIYYQKKKSHWSNFKNVSSWWHFQNGFCGKMHACSFIFECCYLLSDKKSLKMIRDWV